MRYYHLMLIVPILTACTSKNLGIESLEENAKSYNDLSNTAYVINDKEIATFTLSGNEILVQLINKDTTSDTRIVDCSVNKKSISLSIDSSQSWNNHYILTLDSAPKKAKIKCSLSDGSKIKTTIKQN